MVDRKISEQNIHLLRVSNFVIYKNWPMTDLLKVLMLIANVITTVRIIRKMRLHSNRELLKTKERNIYVNAKCYVNVGDISQFLACLILSHCPKINGDQIFIRTQKSTN